MIRLHRFLGMAGTHHPGGTAGKGGWVGDKASLEIWFSKSIALSIAPKYDDHAWVSSKIELPKIEERRAWRQPRDNLHNRRRIGEPQSWSALGAACVEGSRGIALTPELQLTLCSKNLDRGQESMCLGAQ